MSPSKDLASAGSFFFAPIQYSQIQAFTACFAPSTQLYIQCSKTAQKALQALFLRFAPFYRRRYQTDTIDYNATCATLERITAPVRHTPIPDTSATPDTVQLSTADYYKRYIRARPVMDSCQTVQHIEDHASQAGPAPSVCGSLTSADTLPAV